jgi:hypothetical protein
LRRIAGEDFINDLQVVLVELEWDRRVVVGLVAVLKRHKDDRVRHVLSLKAIESPQCQHWR